MKCSSENIGFKPYIRVNIPRNWEIILKRHKCVGKFVDAVYSNAVKGTAGYSRKKQYDIIGYTIRVILHNEGWFKAFFRSYYTTKMEIIIQELNDLKEQER